MHVSITNSEKSVMLELQKQFDQDLKCCLLFKLFPEHLVFIMMLEQDF